jgi:RNA polymerase sigma-70 factor (ECF subfamily)
VGDRRWRRLLSRVPRGWPRFGAPRPVSPDPWAWLEPYPGAPSGSAPGTLSIGYVSALQRLPPDQRAALLLSDVLGFGLADVAEILDCDTAGAGHLLARARSAMPPPARAPQPSQASQTPQTPRTPGSAPAPAPGRTGTPVDTEDAVVARFTSAFDRGDIAAIAALLAPDAWLRMRPLPVAYRGRRTARHFLAVVAFPGGTRGYRLVATRANGQPAFGCYLRDPAAALDHACGLVLLTVDGGRIAAIDRFTDNSLLARFGLPRTLPAVTELRGTPRDHAL